MRSRAKAVNFGIVYGQTAFGLAQATGMSRVEAQGFITAYFERYPRIRDFVEECMADARRDGFVRTILGRRRPIPDINSSNQAVRGRAERLAVNTVIQGRRPT
jgi:DNA polymerase-1